MTSSLLPHAHHMLAQQEVTEDLNVDPEENSSHYMHVLIEALSILGKVEEALDVSLSPPPCLSSLCLCFLSTLLWPPLMPTGHWQSHEERVCSDSGEGFHQSDPPVSREGGRWGGGEVCRWHMVVEWSDPVLGYSE